MSAVVLVTIKTAATLLKLFVAIGWVREYRAWNKLDLTPPLQLSRGTRGRLVPNGGKMVLILKSKSPEVLPKTLQSGTRVTFLDGKTPYVLAGEARLEMVSEGGHIRARYIGDWQRAGDKPSSFVAAEIVDWDHWLEKTVTS